MPATPATFREIEEEARDRILALDASAFKQGGSAPKWKESSTPITVLQDPSSLAHLLFSVWIQSAINTDLESDLIEDGQMWVETRLNVLFAYRMRGRTQTEDARSATDAAIDIVRALMSTWDQNKGCALIRAVDVLQQSISVDGEYIVILQNYTAAFDLRLDPTPSTSPP